MSDYKDVIILLHQITGAMIHNENRNRLIKKDFPRNLNRTSKESRKCVIIYHNKYLDYDNYQIRIKKKFKLFTTDLNLVSV